MAAFNFFESKDIFKIGASSCYPISRNKNISLEVPISIDYDFEIKKSTLFNPLIVAANGSTYRAYRDPFVGNILPIPATACACAQLKYNLSGDVIGFTLAIADGVDCSNATSAAEFAEQAVSNVNQLIYRGDDEKLRNSFASILQKITLPIFSNKKSQLSCITSWYQDAHLIVRGFHIGNANIVAYSPNNGGWYSLGEMKQDITSPQFLNANGEPYEMSYIDILLPPNVIFIAMTQGCTDMLRDSEWQGNANGNIKMLEPCKFQRRYSIIDALTQCRLQFSNPEQAVNTILNTGLFRIENRRQNLLQFFKLLGEKGCLFDIALLATTQGGELAKQAKGVQLALQKGNYLPAYNVFVQELTKNLAQLDYVKAFLPENAQSVPTTIGDNATILALQLPMPKKSWF